MGNKLKEFHFDAVIDTAYNADDVNLLLNALNNFGEYVMISSSAVYPETNLQPFTETAELGPNKYWRKYGTDKIEAEQTLLNRNPQAYILRPPYLYGKMNNLYREAFVFDCALANRVFYLPKDGNVKLQFFHIGDLCRFIETILEKKPENHIFNLGNKASISIREWVELCYEAVGKIAVCKPVFEEIEQRKYFPFYDYEYRLDVTRQHAVLPFEKDLSEGLQETALWYVNHQDEVMKKPFIKFIDENLCESHLG